MPIEICIYPPDLSASYLRLAVQMSATGIVYGPPREYYEDGVWDFRGWLMTRQRIEDADLKWLVCEGIPISDRIKQGLPGRDEDLDKFMRSLRAMGQAGIPTLCYNWMTVFNWLRTSLTTPVRGGAQATRYQHSEMQRGGLTEYGEVSQESLWEALAYFMRAVVPVAEEVNVQLAMHPDDPPLSPIRGIGRIMSSPEDFARLFTLATSPMNGLTFCQGCFSEMGADVLSLIRTYAAQKKLFFAHFRNVRGSAEDFCEIFHDEPGNANMAAAMRAYLEAGFEGPIRPDHMPTMEGDTSGHAGYTTMGRLYAVGYMRGLIDALTLEN
ncbi:MAG: mannonate dehydratase [Chloroflexi bacterium]|nr:mannonate dehydratase [Chloroflexota bacterium]